MYYAYIKRKGFDMLKRGQFPIVKILLLLSSSFVLPYAYSEYSQMRIDHLSEGLTNKSWHIFNIRLYQYNISNSSLAPHTYILTTLCTLSQTLRLFQLPRATELLVSSALDRIQT